MPFPIRRPLCVLIVEDDRDGADSLAALLAMHGYCPAVAQSMPEALAQAVMYPPHVVFLDISRAWTDDCELARRLLELPGRTPVVVALSGDSDDEHRRRAREAGIHLIWPKPVDPGAVLGFLESCQKVMHPESGRDPELVAPLAAER
jgi:CheY-like chemotaxis protein